MHTLVMIAVLGGALEAQAEPLHFDFSQGIVEAGGYLGLGIIDTAFLVRDIVGSRAERGLAILEIAVALPQIVAFSDEAVEGDPLRGALALGATVMLAHGIFVLAADGEPPPVTPVITPDSAGFVAAGRF